MNNVSVSDNGDTKKVLATVVAAVYAFCNHYLDAYVYDQEAQKHGQGFIA